MNVEGQHLLQEVKREFMKCVHAKAIAQKARMEKIIPEPVETDINKSKSLDEARRVLFEHLRDQGTPEALRSFCSIMIESEGYHRMQKFGKRLLAKLEEVIPEDHADHERKQQKDSDSAGQHSSALDIYIGRELNQCIEVNIEVPKTKEIEPEEVIQLLHSRICQCIAQTLVQQLDNIRERISGDCTQPQSEKRSNSKPILNIYNTWIHNVILHGNPFIRGTLIGLLALIFAIQFVLTFAHAYFLDQSVYHGNYSKEFAFCLVLLLRGFTRCGLPLCLLIVTLQIAMKRRSATSPVPQEDFTREIEKDNNKSVLQDVVKHFWNEGLASASSMDMLKEIQSHFETAHIAMHIGSIVEAIILTVTLWKLEAAFYISAFYKMHPHIGIILSLFDIVTFFALNLSCGMMFSLFLHEITMKHIVAAVVKVNDYSSVELSPDLKRSAKVTLDHIVSSWTWLELFLYLGVQIYSFILVISAAAQIPLSYGILGDVYPNTWLIFVSVSTLFHILSTSAYHAPYIRSIGIVMELLGLFWLLWFDTPKFGSFLQILYVTIPGAYLFWYLVVMTRHEYLVLGQKQRDSRVKHYRRCGRNLAFLVQWTAVLIVSITFEYLLLEARAIESQRPVGGDFPLHAGSAETFSRTVGSHFVHEMFVRNGNTSSPVCSCLPPRGP